MGRVNSAINKGSHPLDIPKIDANAADDKYVKNITESIAKKDKFEEERDGENVQVERLFQKNLKAIRYIGRYANNMSNAKSVVRSNVSNQEYTQKAEEVIDSRVTRILQNETIKKHIQMALQS